MKAPFKARGRHFRQCACLRTQKARKAKKHGFEVLRWDTSNGRWVHAANVKLYERLAAESAKVETVLARCLHCGSELLREHPPAEKKETTMKLTLNLIQTGTNSWSWDLCDETVLLQPKIVAQSSPKDAKPTLEALKAHLVEILTAIQSDEFAVYAITNKGRTRIVD